MNQQSSLKKETQLILETGKIFKILFKILY